MLSKIKKNRNQKESLTNFRIKTTSKDLCSGLERNSNEKSILSVQGLLPSFRFYFEIYSIENLANEVQIYYTDKGWPGMVKINFIIMDVISGNENIYHVREMCALPFKNV